MSSLRWLKLTSSWMGEQGAMNDLEELKLEELHLRHPGLTEALCRSYAEAAFVCFSRHHEPPVTLSLEREDNHVNQVVNFPVPGDRIRNAHANEIDATEMGAYGVSLAAVEAVAGLVAVRRAETLTGADWYIAHGDTNIDDLEECIRLEVSGVSAGTSNDIKRRLREKITQAARGKSNLPAMAAIVGFKVLEVAIAPLGDDG
jgi:hypothetical protein